MEKALKKKKTDILGFWMKILKVQNSPSSNYLIGNVNECHKDISLKIIFRNFFMEKW